MKLNKTKLKQIILEVLNEQEEMVQMVKATVEEKTVERREVSDMENEGWSRMDNGNEEVEEVGEIIRTAMEAYKTKKKLQQQQADQEEETT
jgi:hypothetical protein